jgi:hypothetical protein
MATLGLRAFASGLRHRHSAWRVFRAVLFLFNLHTLLLCAATCAATALCASRGWSYDLDSQFFVMAVPFPLTFALTQAFTRRERVLGFAAELKASAVGIYLAFRDWPQVFPPNGGGGGLRARGGGASPANGGPATMAAAPPRGRGPPRYPGSIGDNERNPWAAEARAVLVDFLAAARDYLGTPTGHESVGEARLLEHHGSYFRELVLGGGPSTAARARGARARLLEPTASLAQRVRQQARDHPGHGALMRVYTALSRLHVLNEHLSQASRYGRGAEGGASRTAQYIRFMSAQFEQLRTVKDYRTPSMLRACCAVLVHLGCLALAPYFVHRGSCADWGTGPRGVGPMTGDGLCPAPYVNAIIYVCVSMLLLNVQASAEHPFDADGVDDIFFELADELFEVATLPSERGPVSLDSDGGQAGGDGVLFGPAVAAAREAEAEMVRLDDEAVLLSGGRGGRGGGAAVI